MALNSVKFTLKGSIFLKDYIRDDFCYIHLKDTGIGMNSSMVNQINDFAQTNTHIIIENYINSLGIHNENQIFNRAWINCSFTHMQIFRRKFDYQINKRIGYNSLCKSQMQRALRSNSWNDR